MLLFVCFRSGLYLGLVVVYGSGLVGSWLVLFVFSVRVCGGDVEEVGSRVLIVFVGSRLYRLFLGRFCGIVFFDLVRLWGFLGISFGVFL